MHMMCTLFQISMWIFSSGMVGGGVHGKVVGIVRIIMTGGGRIMLMLPAFIMT